jgi:hypothetical protein
MIIPYFHGQMINTMECSYGGWAVSGDCLHLYVERGLGVNKNVKHLFHKHDEFGVGHCILSFGQIQSFKGEVSLYKFGEKPGTEFSGEIILWEHKLSEVRDGLTEYGAAGVMLHPFGWTDWRIFAKSFELIIL